MINTLHLLFSGNQFIVLNVFTEVTLGENYSFPFGDVPLKKKKEKVLTQYITLGSIVIVLQYSRAVKQPYSFLNSQPVNHTLYL